jgi:DNA-binding NtrC family response regulator
VIDESRFQPLGAAESQRADVRLVVATLAPLEPEVAAGRFNPELFARLRSVTITLPPLADRREDIPQLVQHFIGQLNDQHGTHVRGISADALQRLMRHPLPENIRQLRNIVEYAMVMCRTDCIELDCLPGELDRIAPDESRAKPLDPLAQAEADAIRQALHKFAGHRGRTAEALGIDKSTLWRKMKRHGIRFP